MGERLLKLVPARRLAHGGERADADRVIEGNFDSLREGEKGSGKEAARLMSGKRRKNQLVPAFADEGRRAAPKASGEGTESLTAKPIAESPAPNTRWMEEVRGWENGKRAWARVQANKAGPGVDGRTVEQLPDSLQEHGPGADAPNTRSEHRTDGGRVSSLRTGLVLLLRKVRNAECAGTP
jgi:hypothetical protein